jgi:hypothetical protein
MDTPSFSNPRAQILLPLLVPVVNDIIQDQGVDDSMAGSTGSFVRQWTPVNPPAASAGFIDDPQNVDYGIKYDVNQISSSGVTAESTSTRAGGMLGANEVDESDVVLMSDGSLVPQV